MSVGLPPDSLEGNGGRRLVLLDDAAEPEPAGRDARQTLIHAVASRSDVVSIAPVAIALRDSGAFRQVLVDLGEPEEAGAVDALCGELGLWAPEHRLVEASDSACARTARALAESEALLERVAPTAVVVAGASDAALGFALAAVKLGVPVSRLEGGLRENDWGAPAEVNRALLDRLADTLFAPTAEAAEVLASEGVGCGRLYVVGSTVVDSLRSVQGRARDLTSWLGYGLARGAYVVWTIRHPANVEDDERLARIVEAMASLARRVPVVFPVHASVRNRLELMGDAHRLRAAGVLIEPLLGYTTFVSLLYGAGAIVTDSGVIQEEASALGVPCFTLLETTERAMTLSYGTNRLVGPDPAELVEAELAVAAAAPRAIPLWDGRAGERIAKELVANYALVPTPGTSSSTTG